MWLWVLRSVKLGRRALENWSVLRYCKNLPKNKKKIFLVIGIASNNGLNRQNKLRSSARAHNPSEGTEAADGDVDGLN